MHVRVCVFCAFGHSRHGDSFDALFVVQEFFDGGSIADRYAMRRLAPRALMLDPKSVVPLGYALWVSFRL